jgi:hypothetical protein
MEREIISQELASLEDQIEWIDRLLCDDEARIRLLMNDKEELLLLQKKLEGYLKPTPVSSTRSHPPSAVYAPKVNPPPTSPTRRGIILLHLHMLQTHP